METVETVNSSRRLAMGYAAGIAGGMFWAVGGACGESIFKMYGLTASWLVPIRMLTAGLIMLLAAGTAGYDLMAIWKNKKNIPLLLLFAIMGLDVCQFGYYSSVQYSTAALGTVLSYMTPIFILAWNAFRQRRRPWFYELLSIILVMAGTVICATHGDFSTMVIDPRALFWGIIGAIGFAFYTLVPGNLIKEFGLFTVIGWGMLIAGILITPVCRPWTVQGTVPADFRLVILFMSVVLFGTIFSFSLYQFGCSIIGGFAGSIISAVEPIASIAISVVILHNRFVSLDFLGFFLIMVTIPIIAVGDTRIRRIQNQI